MKQFVDDEGRQWVATTAKEDTPRHHGKYYLVFHPADDAATQVPAPDIRWQTPATGARTIRTMADVELRRRLKAALARYAPA